MTDNMPTPSPSADPKGFEQIKLVNPHGAEYWSARDLQVLLGYSQWRRFEEAVTRAVTSCNQSGNDPSHHFAGAGKMVTLGSGSQLICCSAFRCNVSEFENLTVKKIPKAVLKKCEWGHDDYSLEIENLPDAPPEVIEQQEAKTAANGKPVRKFGKDKNAGPTLFEIGEMSETGGEQ